MHDKIKSRLNSGNACYHSVQSPLSSRLLSRIVKVKKVYSTIILSVVLYGCETWSVTLREEHRPRVFENGALRRLFWPNRGEVVGEWTELHNEELCNLYWSPNIIRQIRSRRMRWAGHVTRMGEERKLYRVWWESPKERDNYEDWGVDKRMISELILER
jgi:hypothetical protein